MSVLWHHHPMTIDETAAWYTDFAERQARGESPSYERLAHAVAADTALLERLAELPEPKRQPNLLFAAVRRLGGPTDDPAVFRDWVERHWIEVSAIMRVRRTQTNEAGRCAALLPVLASLPGPLALLEVGASAGLCLYPDRYRYRYDGKETGPAGSPVLIECATEGDVPVPAELPTVVWRAGLDLNPLDIGDDDTLGWLDALIWPEHGHRRERLRAAASVVRADPPLLVTGDLRTDLPRLAAQAPPDATLVVFHTSVLAYVRTTADREAFAAQAMALPGHWIANETAEALSTYGMDVPPTPNGTVSSVVALDGRPVAFAGQHGQSLRWLG